jgi:hypothetical protein
VKDSTAAALRLMAARADEVGHLARWVLDEELPRAARSESASKAAKAMWEKKRKTASESNAQSNAGSNAQRNANASGAGPPHHAQRNAGSNAQRNANASGEVRFGEPTEGSSSLSLSVSPEKHEKKEERRSLTVKTETSARSGEAEACAVDASHAKESHTQLAHATSDGPAITRVLDSPLAQRDFEAERLRQAALAASLVEEFDGPRKAGT